MPKPKIDPQKVRATATWDLDLIEGSVTMRRCDLMNEVLTGHLPPDAVRRGIIFERLSYEQQAAALQGQDPNALLAAQVEAMEPKQRMEVLQTLREYACVAIVSPKFVMKDDGDPNSVPVSILSTMDLVAVWGARPPANVTIDPQQPVAVPETAAQASRFPEEVEVGNDLPEPVDADGGGSVPPLENVPVQTVATPDGGMVEFAGC